MWQASKIQVSAMKTLIIIESDYFLKGTNFPVLIFTGRHEVLVCPYAELSPQEKPILCADADAGDC